MKPHSASLAGGDNEERAHLSPRELRSRMRRGAWDTPTAGLAPGYAQANLVILPRDYAYDFLLFCQRNPKPCPLEVTDVGSPHLRWLAPEADLRTDLPRYRIYRDGELAEEVDEITPVCAAFGRARLIGPPPASASRIAPYPLRGPCVARLRPATVIGPRLAAPAIPPPAPLRSRLPQRGSLKVCAGSFVALA